MLNETHITTYPTRTAASDHEDQSVTYRMAGGILFTDDAAVRKAWRIRLSKAGFRYFFEYHDTRGRCSLSFGDRRA